MLGAGICAIFTKSLYLGQNLYEIFIFVLGSLSCNLYNFAPVIFVRYDSTFLGGLSL